MRHQVFSLLFFCFTKSCKRNISLLFSFNFFLPSLSRSLSHTKNMMKAAEDSRAVQQTVENSCRPPVYSRLEIVSSKRDFLCALMCNPLIESKIAEFLSPWQLDCFDPATKQIVFHPPAVGSFHSCVAYRNAFRALTDYVTHCRKCNFPIASQACKLFAKFIEDKTWRWQSRHSWNRRFCLSRSTGTDYRHAILVGCKQIPCSSLHQAYVLKGEMKLEEALRFDEVSKQRSITEALSKPDRQMVTSHDLELQDEREQREVAQRTGVVMTLAVDNNSPTNKQETEAQYLAAAGATSSGVHMREAAQTHKPRERARKRKAPDSPAAEATVDDRLLTSVSDTECTTCKEKDRKLQHSQEPPLKKKRRGRPPSWLRVPAMCHNVYTPAPVHAQRSTESLVPVPRQRTIEDIEDDIATLFT